MSDDRPNRYVEDGWVIWRASAIGMCPRSLVAEQLGMSPDPTPGWMLRKWDEGVAGEPVVLGMMKEQGWVLGQEQVQVEMQIGTHLKVRGHLDALGETRVIEVKCVSEDYAAEIMRQVPPLYFWQCSVYGRATALPVILVLGVKDADGQVVRLETMDVQLAGPAAVKLRVAGLERAIAEGVLPDCTYRQFPCPFPELCQDIGVPEPTEDWDLEDALCMSLKSTTSLSSLDREPPPPAA